MFSIYTINEKAFSISNWICTRILNSNNHQFFSITRMEAKSIFLFAEYFEPVWDKYDFNEKWKKIKKLIRAK